MLTTSTGGAKTSSPYTLALARTLDDKSNQLSDSDLTPRTSPQRLIRRTVIQCANQHAFYLIFSRQDIWFISNTHCTMFALY